MFSGEHGPVSFCTEELLDDGREDEELLDEDDNELVLDELAVDDDEDVDDEDVDDELLMEELEDESLLEDVLGHQPLELELVPVELEDGSVGCELLLLDDAPTDDDEQLLLEVLDEKLDELPHDDELEDELRLCEELLNPIDELDEKVELLLLTSPDDELLDCPEELEELPNEEELEATPEDELERLCDEDDEGHSELEDEICMELVEDNSVAAVDEMPTRFSNSDDELSNASMTLTLQSYRKPDMSCRQWGAHECARDLRNMPH